jgi:opacity protein-like surface antigen
LTDVYRHNYSSRTLDSPGTDARFDTLTARAGTSRLIHVVLLVALLALHVSADIATAQNTISTDVGARAWYTSGYTKWNFTAGDPPVNPLSELRWRGTDTVIAEANVDLVWRTLVVMLRLGGGRPHDGAFLDDDFFSDNYRDRFSHTRSGIDDSHIFYAMGDVGYRALQWHDAMSGTRGFLDVFVGYQYQEEKYVAFGLTGTFGLLPFIPIEPQAVPTSTKVITHTYRFHSLRLGARAVVPLGGKFAFRLGGVLLPYTRTELEDIHHLRTDFAQDPSGRSRADGGFGYQVDAGLTYRVWKGLSVEAGYRVWRLDSGSGTETTFFSDGTTARDKLNEIIVERGGPYFGLQYRF